MHECVKTRNMREKVQALQSKLFCAAKRTLDRKFGALYDKIYREDVLWTAWKRVRANKGAPGIDEKSIEYIENEIGVEAFLVEIQQALRSRKYRALPGRRCWIKKPGKPDKRPLGIPVIRDRTVQAAAKLIIEPIFETNFLESSYGFRPKRSAHMAIKAIDKAITWRKQTTVIDADITGFFDNIRQDILMKLVERRISDPRVLRLIRGWLRAGVMEEGVFIEPNGLGTPQGGVISPLLANIYLHSFDKMFQESGIPGTLVRYADDFVLLVRNNGEEVLKRVRWMLNRLGLEMHPEKTRIVQAKDGFDFLGVHFCESRILRRKTKMKRACRLWPSDRSMQRIKQRVKEVVGRRYNLSLEGLIEELNPVIRGWNNYHKAVHPERERLLKLNEFVWERMRIFQKRKYNDQTRGCRRVHDNLPVRLGLCQFG